MLLILTMMKKKNPQINLNNKLLCFKGNAFADNFKKPKSLHLELE